MKKYCTYLKTLLLIIAGSFLLAGCGSSSSETGNSSSPAKSSLQLDFIETSPSANRPAGIEFKIDYDQSLVRPDPDVNKDAERSVLLSGGLARKETYMMAYDNGDIITINLLNARGFDNGGKQIRISFDVLNHTSGIITYHITPGTLKIFDLNGGEMDNFEVILNAEL